MHVDAVERDSLFRTLIRDLRIGVLVQGPNAEIRVSNRAALELLGLEESQLLGKTSFDPEWHVIHEDGSPFPGPEHPVPTAIGSKRSVRGVVMGVYRPRSRDRVWLLVDAEPQLDPDGEVAQVVCTFSDFTERRRLQSTAMIEDRMASMGRLAAGVAHEVNNPLAYVTANLDIIRETLARAGAKPPAPDDAAELATLVEECREGVGRIRTLVDDLRALSRGDDRANGAVDLRRVVDSACNIVARHVPHRAELVRDLRPVPFVEGNEARLGQLVLNLLMNAMDAIPEGRARNNEVRVTTRVDDGGRVVVEVRDTGPGIARDVLAHIFDPFFTTKPIGAGTGLGLAICHEIVRSCGGDIEAESEPGRGSTFRVRLHASAPVAAAPPKPVVEKPPPSKLLIIDDEPLVARTLGLLLGDDHDVHVADRVSDALDRVRAGESFDLIFCDLMMPDMTGMDLQAVLERERPDLAQRTVFITGGAFTPRAQVFVEAMPERVLEKPFDSAAIDRVIARVGRAAR